MATIKKGSGLKNDERWYGDLSPEYQVKESQYGSNLLCRLGEIKEWWIFRWRSGTQEIGYIPSWRGHDIKIRRGHHSEAEPLSRKLRGKGYTIILE